MTPPPGTAWGERGDAAYFNNPIDYVAHLGGEHLDWLRLQLSLLLVVRAGPVGGHDRRTRLDPLPRGAARIQGHPIRARPVGV